MAIAFVAILVGAAGVVLALHRDHVVEQRLEAAPLEAAYALTAEEAA